MHKNILLTFALLYTTISFADYPASQGYQVPTDHEHHHNHHHKDHHRREYTEREKIVIQQCKDRLEEIKQEKEGYHLQTNFCFFALVASLIGIAFGGDSQFVAGILGTMVFSVCTKISRDGDLEQDYNRDKEEKKLVCQIETIEKSLEHHHRHHH